MATTQGFAVCPHCQRELLAVKTGYACNPCRYFTTDAPGCFPAIRTFSANRKKKSLQEQWARDNVRNATAEGLQWFRDWLASPPADATEVEKKAMTFIKKELERV